MSALQVLNWRECRMRASLMMKSPGDSVPAFATGQTESPRATIPIQRELRAERLLVFSFE